MYLETYELLIIMSMSIFVSLLNIYEFVTFSVSFPLNVYINNF